MRITTIIPAIILVLAANAAEAAAPQTRKVSVQGLIYDLKHPEVDRRVEAARLLGQNKIRTAVPALIEATGDSDETVRLEVLNSLDGMRDNRARLSFVTLTADSNATIREKSIDAIVHLYVLDETGFIAGTKKVFRFLNPFDSNYNDLLVEAYLPIPEAVYQALASRLDDPEPKVRKAAVMALGILRGRPVLDRMREVCRDEPEGTIQIEYLRSYFKIGDPAVCPEVLPFINAPEKNLHDEAILVAGLLRCREAVPALMDIYESGIKERRKVLAVVPASSEDDLQIKCLQSLAMIGDPLADKIFLPALRHESLDFQVAAAEGLARLANPEHAEAIGQRKQAARNKRLLLALEFACYRLGQKESLAPLVDGLGSGQNQQVFGYLLEIPPAQLPELYPFLRHSKGKVRIRLLEVLGLAGNQATLEEVQRYTSDSDIDVALEALLAVRRIQARN